jgi:hypothetical protein
MRNPLHPLYYFGTNADIDASSPSPSHRKPLSQLHKLIHNVTS